MTIETDREGGARDRDLQVAYWPLGRLVPFASNARTHSEGQVAARREWERLVGELGKLRLLTPLDRAALAAYCGAYALWAEATQAINTYGSMVKSPSGFPMQSPYIAVANRQAEIMMRISSEFGFTPASRGRIVSPTKPQLSLFETVQKDEEPLP